MKNQTYFITGISTEVGKTIVSAIVTQALQADYWKPVQAGELEHSDTHKVQQLVSNTKTKFHASAFNLKTPMSPHAAAKIDGVGLSVTKIKRPKSQNNLVIEGAGGLLVPLNYKGDTILDLIKYYDAEVVLVCTNYLGSINHTLLSVDALKKRNIPIVGILYIGDENSTTESIIEKCTNVPVLGRIPIAEELNKSFVQGQAELINQSGILKKGLKEIYE